MNAQLKPIQRAIKKPVYIRWDLVQSNDRAAWIRANRESLMAWYNDTAPYADPLETFENFAQTQFAFERDQFEQLKDDAVGYDDYVTEDL